MYRELPRLDRAKIGHRIRGVPVRRGVHRRLCQAAAGIMEKDETRHARSDGSRRVESVRDVYDDEISWQRLLRTLCLYRQVMSLTVAGVMACFVAAGLVTDVSRAVERVGTVEFRLLFEGASQGRYWSDRHFLYQRE